MLHLPLVDGRVPLRRVLVLGAHADDVEIGCGATLLALQQAADLDITWVVLSADGAREDEARSSAEGFLADATVRTVACHHFRDGYFPYVGAEIKDVFEALKREVDPQLILTHTRHDMHQDHRLVCELTWNTWRDHLILEYEIPKYDGDHVAPNVFAPVSRDLARRKVDLLLNGFASQTSRDWFDEEVFMGFMRRRGMEARAPSLYAEAFTCRKLSFLIA